MTVAEMHPLVVRLAVARNLTVRGVLQEYGISHRAFYRNTAATIHGAAGLLRLLADAQIPAQERHLHIPHDGETFVLVRAADLPVATTTLRDRALSFSKN